MRKKKLRAILAYHLDWMFLYLKHDGFEAAVLMGLYLEIISSDECEFLIRASIYYHFGSKGASASFTPHRQEV